MTKRKALYVVAADEITEAIRCGEYKPGQWVTARLLAERFETTVAVAHAAIRLLLERELVYTVPSLGTFIATPGEDEEL